MSKIDQMKLMADITELLIKKHKARCLNTRHINAIIAAANLIKKDLDIPHIPATPNMGFSAWYRSDDVAPSSLYMASVLCPAPFLLIPTPEYAHPYDAMDFDRCYKFLRAIPNIKENLPLMISTSPAWKNLVERWQELETLYKKKDTLKLTKLIRTLVS